MSVSAQIFHVILIRSTYNRIEQTLDSRVLVCIIHERRTASFEITAVRGSLKRVAATADSAVDANLPGQSQLPRIANRIIPIIHEVRSNPEQLFVVPCPQIHE